MEIAQKIKKAREALRLTQQELSILVGTSKRSVAAWEIGQSLPRPATLRKIASALKVSPDYLKLDSIDDPAYGMEKQEYINEARDKFGEKAAKEMDFLLERQKVFFAGGEISQEAKDAYFEAVMKAYLKSKEAAKKTFGKKAK